MIPTTVSPPAAAVTPPPEVATPNVDAGALQRQIDELKASAEEHKRTAEFWYGKAQEKPQAAATPAAAVDAEPEVDVLELATRGGKAFEKYMEGWAKKAGFVRGDQMEQAISAKAQELAKQAELVSKYPDLKKNDSEFFKSTALEYGQLKKQGLSESLAMEMAAERVELRFLREGKTKTPAQIAEEKERTREQARRDRAAAGGADHSSRRAAPVDEEDTEMTDAQRQIAIRMLVDDDTTPEQAIEKYKARATKGVAMRLK